MEKLLTIFTPTFNRGYVLKNLYKSLVHQTDLRFEWIIIDDGSSDDTYDLVNRWILENKISIKYIYQKNMGKSYAHNVAVQKCTTLLFTCVDSDDYLTENAVEVILKNYIINSSFVGFVYKRGYDNFESITKWDSNLKSASLYNAEKKYHLKGDTFLVFKTIYLKKYKFPNYKNEKFVPENYLYDLLHNDGELFFYDDILYICKYLPDGYTKNMREVIAKNPNGYRAYIINRLKLDDTFKDKVLDTIRYNSIQFVINRKEILLNSVYPGYSFFLIIFGWLFYLKNYKKFLKNKVRG